MERKVYLGLIALLASLWLVAELQSCELRRAMSVELAEMRQCLNSGGDRDCWCTKGKR